MIDPVPADAAPTDNIEEILSAPRPDSINGAIQPVRAHYFPSPDDWRNELFYFAMVDRFSDEATHRPLLDRENPSAPSDENLLSDSRWDLWAMSGRNRFQGGTLAGVRSRLPYLTQLGITAIWISPVTAQRRISVDGASGRDDRSGQVVDDKFPDDPAAVDRATELRVLLQPFADYHGYAIHDFLDVDYRFGNRRDLCELITAAHDLGIRVVLDVMINHTGENFSYASQTVNTLRPPYPPPPVFGSRYPFGAWLDQDNQPMEQGKDPTDPAEGVWPKELQSKDFYNRKGFGDYGADDPAHENDDDLEIRVADWMNRDIAYNGTNPEQDPQLSTIIKIWKYWIALTDCDGFRIDTFKHVPIATGQFFVQEIRKYAASLGKHDFFVVAEVGGTDAMAATFNNAANDGVRTLEVGERRNLLRRLAAGDNTVATADVLLPKLPGVPGDFSDRVLMSIDDHDGLGLQPHCRIAAAYTPDTVVPATALLLFGPGIPCLYYGTEQALSGPPVAGRPLLWTNYGLNYGGPEVTGNRGGDRYLREAMFGPEHPRQLLSADPDLDLPGFGPAGSSGYHVFDAGSRWYAAISAMATLRSGALATGQIELCSVRDLPIRQGISGHSRLLAWTRGDADDGWLVVVNTEPDVGGPDGISWPAENRTCDVLLPMWWPDQATLRLTATPVTGQNDPTPSAVTVRRTDQVGWPYLTVTELPPRSVRIYSTRPA